VRNGTRFEVEGMIGYLGEDLVSGIQTEKVRVLFGQVVKYDSYLWRHTRKSDGILGLGMTQKQIIQKNLVEVLFEQGQI
jgi:hypothetical protein